MARLIVTRLSVGVLTLLAAAILVFLGVEALPGDAATAALGQGATPERVAEFRKDLGLDRPAVERFGDWLWGLLHGNLGTAIPSKEPVTSIIADKLRNTGVLAGLTLVLLVPLSVLLGVVSAVKRDSWADRGLMLSTLSLIATPEFVIGTLLVLALAVWLGLLPPVSLVNANESLLSQLKLLVLPVLTLLAASAAQTVRMIRSCMIDALDADFIEMARLRGLTQGRIVFLHALPNAFGPTLQIIAQNTAWLIGGVVVVEAVFQFPGVGRALTDAVGVRDIPTVQGITILIAATYVAMNLLADLGQLVLNPRLRVRAH